MTTTASDRVQVRSQGELMHPGACALCGSGNCDEGYLDVGIWYEYEGQQYYCMNCVNQIIAVAQGLPGEEAAHLQETNVRLAADLVATQKELEEARVLLGKWNDLIDSVGASGLTPSIDCDSPAIPIPTPEQIASDGANGGSEEVNKPEPEPVKPSTGKRPPKPGKSSATNSAGQFDL